MAIEILPQFFRIVLVEEFETTCYFHSFANLVDKLIVKKNAVSGDVDCTASTKSRRNERDPVKEPAHTLILSTCA